MYTVSVLARRFGLSRSALLHYDRIGLLRPSGRSAAGYRLYTEDDARRLEMICVYRNADVPLETIATLLRDTVGSSVREALSRHLAELDRRIRTLKTQQGRVLALLGSAALPEKPTLISAAEMTAMLRGAGLDDDGLDRLHALFERTDPLAHQAFLEALGLGPADAAAIRFRARTWTDGGGAPSPH